MATVNEDADYIARIVALEQQAQRAGERRIHDAHATLDVDLDDGGQDVELAGAYCGCLTCDVREVLDAAWPYLYRIAVDPGTPEPPLPDRD